MAKEYVKNGDISIKDFVAGGLGGLIGGFTRLNEHMALTNAAKEGIKSVSTSFATSALKNERLNLNDLPKDLIKGLSAGFLTGPTLANPWDTFLETKVVPGFEFSVDGH